MINVEHDQAIRDRMNLENRKKAGWHGWFAGMGVAVSIVLLTHDVKVDELSRLLFYGINGGVLPAVFSAVARWMEEVRQALTQGGR